MKQEDELVPLGEITKAQGLKGEFRVRAYAIESENLVDLEKIFLEPPSKAPFACNVISVRAQRDFYVVQVEEVSHIDQVAPLIGARVLARRSDIAPLAPGEYYWFELIGLTAKTRDGREIGTVKSIVPTGANDVLAVSHGSKEVLIPYVDEVVVEVDMENKVIVIDPPEGLLD